MLDGDTQPVNQSVRRREAWRHRGQDRRRGLPELLMQLGEGLKQAEEPVLLRRRLEETLRRLLAVRALVLRDGTAGRLTNNGSDLDVVGVDVPARWARDGCRLEAVVDRATGLDAWGRQLLDAARHVAALVLELERVQVQTLLRPGSVSPSPGGEAPALVGSSRAICRVRERVARVAATDFTVLVEGESGSGKELVARQIHAFSRRRSGPFVAVNCAALVESLLEAELFGIEERTATGVRGRRGKFEHADQGTLFLDEVSDLSMSAQAKLLRAIQDMAVERVGGQGARRVDTRFIVATHRRLNDLVDRGHFRLDLYYRLNGVEITVPALRERREDILELAEHFLDRFRPVRSLRLSSPAVDALVAYTWPGNVRELERVIERAVVLAAGDQIQLDDLPPALVGEYAEALLPSARNNETMREWGSRYARLVLERHGRNKRKACQALGISYHTLQAYLRYRPPAAAKP